MGYKFQFITLAGFHSLNYSMFELAHGYRIWAMAQRGRGGGGPQYAWHPLRPVGCAEARPATRMHRGVPP